MALHWEKSAAFSRSLINPVVEILKQILFPMLEDGSLMDTYGLDWSQSDILKTI